MFRAGPEGVSSYAPLNMDTLVGKLLLGPSKFVVRGLIVPQQ